MRRCARGISWAGLRPRRRWRGADALDSEGVRLGADLDLLDDDAGASEDSVRSATPLLLDVDEFDLVSKRETMKDGPRAAHMGLAAFGSLTVASLKDDAPVEALLRDLVRQQRCAEACGLYKNLVANSGSWCHVRQDLPFRVASLNAVMLAFAMWNISAFGERKVEAGRNYLRVRRLLGRLKSREAQAVGLAPDGETYAIVLTAMSTTTEAVTSASDVMAVVQECLGRGLVLAARGWLAAAHLHRHFHVSADGLWGLMSVNEVPLWDALVTQLVLAASVTNSVPLVRKVLEEALRQGASIPEVARARAAHVCTQAGRPEDVAAVVDALGRCNAEVSPAIAWALADRCAVEMRHSVGTDAALGLCPSGADHRVRRTALRSVATLPRIHATAPKEESCRGVLEVYRLLRSCADGFPDQLGPMHPPTGDTPRAALHTDDGAHDCYAQVSGVLAESEERAAEFARLVCAEKERTSGHLLALAVMAVASSPAEQAFDKALDVLKAAAEASDVGQLPHLALLRGWRGRHRRQAQSGAMRGVHAPPHEKILEALRSGGTELSPPLLLEAAGVSLDCDDLDRALQYISEARSAGDHTIPETLWYELLRKACAVSDGRLVLAICGELDQQDPLQPIPASVVGDCRRLLSKWDWRNAVAGRFHSWLASRRGRERSQAAEHWQRRGARRSRDETSTAEMWKQPIP